MLGFAHQKCWFKWFFSGKHFFGNPDFSNFIYVMSLYGSSLKVGNRSCDPQWFPKWVLGIDRIMNKKKRISSLPSYFYHPKFWLPYSVILGIVPNLPRGCTIRIVLLHYIIHWIVVSLQVPPDAVERAAGLLFFDKIARKRLAKINGKPVMLS